MICTTFAGGINPFVAMGELPKVTKYTVASYMRVAAGPVPTAELMSHLGLSREQVMKRVAVLVYEGCIKAMPVIGGKLHRYVFVKMPRPPAQPNLREGVVKYLTGKPATRACVISKAIGMNGVQGSQILHRLCESGKLNREKRDGFFIYWIKK